MTEVWSWLGRVDNLLGIFAFLFSGYAAYRLKQQSKRLTELARRSPRAENFQELVRANQGVRSSAPVALALSLTPQSDSIKGYVQTFLNAQGWRMEIEELNMKGINNAQDMEEFVNALLIKKREFGAKNYTEVHLFVSGPMPACIQVGAVFDNWIPVKLYHKPQQPPPQIYEYWMPLIS